MTTVKVFIKRKISKDKEVAVLTLITQMRAMATRRPGYVSGETLWSADRPDEYLVVSTWRTLESWKAWRESKERAGFQEKIDALTGKETDYEIYRYPEILPDGFSEPLM